MWISDGTGQEFRNLTRPAKNQIAWLWWYYPTASEECGSGEIPRNCLPVDRLINLFLMKIFRAMLQHLK